jgi:hypothetical protein
VLRIMGWGVAGAAFGAWAYEVYLVMTGDTQAGMLIAGVAAGVMLLLAWARGAILFPDGGGP